MKKLLFFPALFVLLLTACVNDNPLSVAKDNTQESPLTVLLEENPDWQHEHLRLYPVVASAGVLSANDRSKNLKTLAEAMQTPGFRILERKQFGRGGDEWYHGLTVQNKTQDTVLMLSGDVVKGGNQDRVIAYHEVIAPMTVKNIEVFCVEAGRSSYYDAHAPAAEKEAAAFKGYYNVASPSVRRAVQTNGNQQEVWGAVEKVTSANSAGSDTKAYTALDNATGNKSVRDAYLQALDGKLATRPDIVGMVAVCGDKVLGVDIFGSPDLFRREYAGLLHGYVAEAAMAASGAPVSASEVQKAFEKVARLNVSHAKSNEEAGKFAWGGAWVHLFGK